MARRFFFFPHALPPSLPTSYLDIFISGQGFSMERGVTNKNSLRGRRNNKNKKKYIRPSSLIFLSNNYVSYTETSFLDFDDQKLGGFINFKLI